MSEAGLNLNNVRIKINGVSLLNIDEKIADGEILTLMGPSGCGKSTLINAICGFLPKGFSCEGEISLDGQNITDLPAEKRKLGVLFQDPLLFPHFDVKENIMFALPSGGAKSERLEKAYQLLKNVNMQDYARRDVATLSGGQKARIALARTLASNPKALLLDEPFSKLDEKLRENVRQSVFEVIRGQNLPTLLVTHDKADAKATNGKIITL